MSGADPGTAPASGAAASGRWGLDIGASTIALGQRMGEGLRVLAQMPTPAEPQLMIAWLSHRLEGRPAGLGVAFGGGIDAAGHVTRWPNQPRWAGFPLIAGLRTVAAAVRVIDDGIAAAAGETRLGVARGRPDVLVVVFGTGLGGALVIDHRPRPVRAGDPRTLGHVRIFSGGACACGGTGCAQTALASLPVEEQLGPALAGWPAGVRLVDFLTDLTRFLGIGAVVVTGGLVWRPRLRAGLTTRLRAAGIETLVPADPSTSSLLGACLLGAR